MSYEPGGWLACTFCAPPHGKKACTQVPLSKTSKHPPFLSPFPSTLKVGVIRSICLLASTTAKGGNGLLGPHRTLVGSCSFPLQSQVTLRHQRTLSLARETAIKTILTLRIQIAAVLQQEISGKCSVRRSRHSHTGSPQSQH